MPMDTDIPICETCNLNGPVHTEWKDHYEPIQDGIRTEEGTGRVFAVFKCRQCGTLTHAELSSIEDTYCYSAEQHRLFKPDLYRFGI